ncbi:gliding motility protein GldC [Salibacter halophilus]|jgi:gliding motility-associated protein GldC|uniref:Gliding motility protein GldC n=1 Tax=Salibacter halophilus TaxID=1803916 RepID=A0A6N6M585_9FLAO|nr:gliding motility protein GldC [Salibacter halophilus]KAB1062873.1 gliding motility protein GldC [Salibacter halophilus]
MGKKSEIKFNIELDENNVPENITWEAEDTGEKGNCDATMLSMWDSNEQNTMRVDLWTKDMTVDDMKLFVYQSILTMSDAFARATGENNHADELRQFAQDWGMKMEIIKPSEN